MPRWTHRLDEEGRTEWISPTGDVVATFPATWSTWATWFRPRGGGERWDPDEEEGAPAVEMTENGEFTIDVESLHVADPPF